MTSGRLVGIILIVVGVLAAIFVSLFLLSGVSGGSLTLSGALLGIAVTFLVLVAPLVGFGIFMVVQGGREAAAQAQAVQQRRLLDIVRSRGQVETYDLSLEMQMSQDELREMIHKLVGMQVFSGYINWDKGVLYSAEGSKLRSLESCENCGGEIELTGKGIVSCRFCGTEYFLA